MNLPLPRRIYLSLDLQGFDAHALGFLDKEP